MPQHINNCRRRASALAVLLLLCASACAPSPEGGAPPDASATPAGEMSANNTQGAAPAATPPHASEVKGDSLADANNINLSKQRPFMVLITDRADCCGGLKAAMYRLRGDGDARLPFFVVDAKNATEVTTSEAAEGGLDVGVKTRSDKLPWVGLFDKRVQAGPIFQAASVKDNELPKVAKDLEAEVTKVRGSMGGAAPAGGADVPSGGRPAAQPDFARLLETHKAELQAYVNARVDEALQNKINAAKENSADSPAAPKDNLQTYVDGRVDESLKRKTTAAVVLLVFSMLAVAASAWSLLRTQQFLKSQKDSNKNDVEELEGRVKTLEGQRPELVSVEHLESRLNQKLLNFVSASQLRATSDAVAEVSEKIHDQDTGLLALSQKIESLGGPRDEMTVVIEDTPVSVTTAVVSLARGVATIDREMTEVRAEFLDPNSNPKQISQKVGELDARLTATETRQKTNISNAKVLYDRLTRVEATLGELVPQIERLNTSAVETSGAMANGLLWLGNMEAARIASSRAGDEGGKDQTISGLEEAAERLRDSAARVAPLAERMGRLVEAVSERPQVSQELKDKLRGFLRDVEWFGRREGEIRQRVAALRGASAGSRYQEFLGEQETLRARFGEGELTAAQFEAAYRESFNSHFSQVAADGAAAADDAELGRGLPRVEDQLMDWFSNFSQLVSRVRGSNAAGSVDGDTVEEMHDALNVAREVLIRFDIQPEEIEIGKTVYDPRVHQLVLARQSTYPAHTVVDVQQSGFRRVRDGETLRRPQVVVAQASEGEHA